MPHHAVREDHPARAAQRCPRRKGATVELHLCLLGVLVLIGLSRWYATHKGPTQVLTLTAGETFLGVLDRGTRDVVFIGNAPGRVYPTVTAEEARLLQQVFDREGC